MNDQNNKSLPVRILVPVDFSKAATNACHYALDIAARTQGSVTLFHAHKPLKTHMVDLAAGKKAYNEQEEAALMNKLLRWKKKQVLSVPRAAAVPVSTVLGHTPVGDNILGFAEDNQVDLIVMGTQGLSGIRKVLIGSVADLVVQETTVPVLVVPEEATWHEFRTIVFSSNYLHADHDALDMVLHLADLFGAKVVVTHVLDALRHSLPAERQRETATFDDYSYTLQRTFPDHEIKFDLIEAASVTEAMESMDQRIPFDLMVMVRRERSFLKTLFTKSFTENMLFLTRQPLLVIPEEGG